MTKKKEQDRAKRQIRATDKQVEAFTLRVQKFLERNVQPVMRDIERAQTMARSTSENKREESVRVRAAALKAAELLGNLESSIGEAGLTKEVAKVGDIYRDQLDYIEDTFRAESTTARDEDTDELVTFRYTEPDRKVIEALIDTKIEQSAKTLGALVGDIRSVVMDSVFAGRQVDISALSESLSDRAIANIQTDLNTSMMTFNRVVTMKKAAEAGLSLFLYVGPADDRMRPFCRARVGKIFTSEEIEEWDNGSDLPANVYLGGYNCRHHLRPISEKRAIELGWEGGESEEAEE